MEQNDILRFAIDALERLQLRYMLVGSLASTMYGEPRMTQDIDMVIELELDQVRSFCEAFPPSDFYLSEPAVRDAVRQRFQFNVLHPASGNKIYFRLAQSDTLGQLQLANRQRVAVLSDQEGYAARPEDIILAKLRYYEEGRSEKHLRDITGILKMQGERLDREYVSLWTERLSVKTWWEMILQRMQT